MSAFDMVHPDSAYVASLEYARQLDAADPLAHMRHRFFLPTKSDGSPYLYLCGNSLGLQPKAAPTYVQAELEDWQKLGVEGHFHARHPWMPYHAFLTESMARIVGAQAQEVVVMNTLTVNLHLMMVSFYRPTATRFKILIEGDAFPSDQYAVKSQLEFHGIDPAEGLIEAKPRPGEAHLRTADLEALIAELGDSLALVMLGGVNYYTGQAYDLARITAAGHSQGAKVGFDLAHAAGNIPLHLHDWGPDFAVWCSYKYLNSGPGSLGGCFVHARHARDTSLPRFAGWWGHDQEIRFKMGPEFQPMPGAEGWQLSNPPILPLAAMRASLELFDEVGMEALCVKSEALTGYLAFLLQELKHPRIHLITPLQPPDRGCQLSIRVQDADKSLFEAITERGVVADWREPDVIRVAPVPMYNRFEDVLQFVEILKEALHAGR